MSQGRGISSVDRAVGEGNLLIVNVAAGRHACWFDKEEGDSGDGMMGGLVTPAGAGEFLWQEARAGFAVAKVAADGG